jgi:hypothetical protein
MAETQYSVLSANTPHFSNYSQNNAPINTQDATRRNSL